MKKDIIKSGIYEGCTYDSIDDMHAQNLSRNAKTHAALAAYNNAETDFALGLISAETLAKARAEFEGGAAATS